MTNIHIVDVPLSGERIVDKNGVPTDQFQALLEAVQFMLNTGKLNAYKVADVPDATKCEHCEIRIIDESGGPTTATSNGTDWLRAQDLAIIS